VAKDSDHSADRTGLLSGLFAEENEFDRRALWRIGTWGLAAVGAVVLAVASNQWSLSLRHDQLAAADVSRQAQQIQSLTRESQNEARRLANAIDTLNNDRDRLFSRITVLEQGLDSVTGTIARQAAVNTNAAPKPPPSVSPPPATMMPPSLSPADSQPQAAAPGQSNQAAAPVTTAAVSKPPATDKPVSDAAKTDTAKTDTAKANPARTELAKSEPAKTELARTDAAKPDTAKTDSVKTDPAPGAIASLPQIAAIKPATPPAAPAAPAQAAAGQPLAASKSMMGPPDPAAPKLVEPAKITNTAPAAAEVASTVVAKDQEQAPGDADANAEAEAAKIQRTEFAVELGGANSISGLRALWRALLKSNNAELAELRPIIVLREGNTGLGMQLRLAAGPLPNAADAARICASLAEMKRACDTTVFDGQRLAMNADEQQAPNGKPATGVKPTGYSRRYYPKHSKKEEPAPPPPEQKSSTSFSSLLGLGKR
jgi:hypothetical protein